MEVGKRIKELRQSHHLKQKDLGLQLGLTGAMISLYETGKRTPPADILTKLAQIFDVSVDYLLDSPRKITENSNYKKVVVTSEEETVLLLYRSLYEDYQNIILGDLKKYNILQKHNNMTSTSSPVKKRA
ncbi:MAG: helix-turn-helix transcriptional regulator [Lachnospiraceae bacterium]|nr:helix-turn-helix transcriptional regulator [Lachnospiraceae bacterium]